MYLLLYHPKTKKQLNRLHPIDQQKITKGLFNLGRNPFSSSLNTKKLVNTQNSYRLRVGNLRVIYEIDTKKKVVYVWKIDYRGNIY